MTLKDKVFSKNTAKAVGVSAGSFALFAVGTVFGKVAGHADATGQSWFHWPAAQEAFQGIAGTFMANPALFIGCSLLAIVVLAVVLRFAVFSATEIGHDAVYNGGGYGV